VALAAAAWALAFAVNWLRWREHADSVTGVAVELRPARQVIKAGERPSLTVTLVNRGSREVVLVEPGDGSDCGWRTPLIEWSQQEGGPHVRCGNINSLRADEVFALKPGDSRQLQRWVGGPFIPGPGRYRVAVRYTNEPSRECTGMPLSPHDPDALEAVRQSTPVSAVSNSVEIVVVP
jgi:hypothetical protein